MVKGKFCVLFGIWIISTSGMDSPEIQLIKLRVEQWHQQIFEKETVQERELKKKLLPNMQIVDAASKHIIPSHVAQLDKMYAVRNALADARRTGDKKSTALLKVLESDYKDERLNVMVASQEIATITGAVIFLWEVSAPMITYCIEKYYEHTDSSSDT